MLRVRLDGSRRPDCVIFRRGPERDHGIKTEDASGQRTRLVECDHADGGKPLEMRATLDEHAVTGRTGQCRHHRYRS